MNFLFGRKRRSSSRKSHRKSKAKVVGAKVIAGKAKLLREDAEGVFYKSKSGKRVYMKKGSRKSRRGSRKSRRSSRRSRRHRRRHTRRHRRHSKFGAFGSGRADGLMNMMGPFP